MTVADLTEEYLLYIKNIKVVSGNTYVSYKNDFALFVNMDFIGAERDIASITAEDIRMCVGRLSMQKKSPATINRFISAVHSLFNYALRFGYLKTNVSAEVRTIKNPRKLPNFLTGTEIDSLCMQPEISPLLWRTRDKALFEMMYSSGCRLSEIYGLKRSDFSKGYSQAKVRGKGGKDRIVYFEDDARRALEAYLKERDEKIKDIQLKNPCDYIFVNQKGGHLSRKGIAFILKTYSAQAGFKRHVNPHALRHTFATAMITQGADVRKVQEMLGHSNINTTQRYTHLSAKQLIESYNKSHPHGSK